MPREKLDKERRKALREARRLIEAVYQADGNEAETRRRLERIFEAVMGYDALKHLSRERSISGAGETEYVDFAIQVEEKPNAEPAILIEVKRASVDLLQKHLKQVTGYAIDCGCEWVLLTNGRNWHLYHVEFGRPPATKLVESWNLLRDELEVLHSKFDLIGYRNVKRGGLDKLWERTEVLQPRSLLRAILCAETLRNIRRVLKRDTGVTVAADDIVGALRKMLNESSARVLQDVEVSLPDSARKSSGRSPTPRVTLSDLVAASLLREGSSLSVSYKGERYVATVQPDGMIKFEGATYGTPSAAGGAVTKKHNVSAPPGWTFWHFTDRNGNEQPLDVLRKQYISQVSQSRGQP